MTEEQQELQALETALVAASNALCEADCLAGSEDRKQIDHAIDKALSLVQKWQRYAVAEDRPRDPRDQWDTWEEWRGER